LATSFSIRPDANFETRLLHGGKHGKFLRTLLLRMDKETFGRAVLAQASLECLVIAQDSDYDPIRRMAETAERVVPACNAMINGEQLLQRKNHRRGFIGVKRNG